MLFLKQGCGLPLDLDERSAFDEYLHNNTCYVIIRKNIMCEIKSVLNDYNIDTVFFKGKFISRLLYDSCIRPVGDLDFYVASDKLEDSLEILKENGFLITNMNSVHHYRLKKMVLKLRCIGIFNMLDDIYATFSEIKGIDIVRNIREIAVKCLF